MLSNEYIDEVGERLRVFIPTHLVHDQALLVPARGYEVAEAVVVRDNRGDLYCLDAASLRPIRDDLQTTAFARAYAERLLWGQSSRQEELRAAENGHAATAGKLLVWGQSELVSQRPCLPLDEERKHEFHFQMGEMFSLTTSIVEAIRRVRELTEEYSHEPALIYLDEVHKVEDSFRAVFDAMRRIKKLHKDIVSYWVYSGKFPPEELAANPDLEDFLARLGVNEFEFSTAAEVAIPDVLAESVEGLTLQIRAGFMRSA